jgi:hypothetical protein
MAGRIGSVQRAQDGQTYGFVLYDAQDRACCYILGFQHLARRRSCGEGGAGVAGDGAGLRAAVTDNLPTARNTLPKDSWLCWSVRCKACGPAWPGGSAGHHRRRQGRCAAEGSEVPLREVRQPDDRCRDDEPRRAARAAVERRRR